MERKALTNWQIVKLAWQIFGGARDLVKGWDFWFTVVIWLCCYRIWSEEKWWDQPIAVLPNLLGFTLGGFAIFLGFGSDAFREIITRKNPLKSPYLSVSAAFVVFVLAQTVALLWALVANGLNFPVPGYLEKIAGLLAIGTALAWALGYFLFLLGIVLAMRACLRIFRLSRWYNDFLISAAQKGNVDIVYPEASNNRDA